MKKDSRSAILRIPWSPAAMTFTVGRPPQPSTDLQPSFLTETNGTELAVLGPNVNLPGANKAFYRVVAVDSAGKRRGPSD